MANGKSSLDREGCEYGRITKKQVFENEEDIVKLREEFKGDFSEIKDMLKDLKETQDQNQYYTDISKNVVEYTVYAVITGLIGYAGYLISKASGLTDFILQG